MGPMAFAPRSYSWQVNSSEPDSQTHGGDSRFRSIRIRLRRTRSATCRRSCCTRRGNGLISPGRAWLA